MGITVKAVLFLAIVFGVSWVYFMIYPHASSSIVSQPKTDTVSVTKTQNPVRATGSSDASLQADLNSIDSQMHATASQSAAADSFSDNPVQQTE